MGHGKKEPTTSRKAKTKQEERKMAFFTDGLKTVEITMKEWDNVNDCYKWGGEDLAPDFYEVGGLVSKDFEGKNGKICTAHVVGDVEYLLQVAKEWESYSTDDDMNTRIPYEEIDEESLTPKEYDERVGVKRILSCDVIESHSKSWSNFLRQFGCYEDEFGNRPCDNGVLCDRCMTEQAKAEFAEYMKDNGR